MMLILRLVDGSLLFLYDISMPFLEVYMPVYDTSDCHRCRCPCTLISTWVVTAMPIGAAAELSGPLGAERIAQPLCRFVIAGVGLAKMCDNVVDQPHLCVHDDLYQFRHWWCSRTCLRCTYSAASTILLDFTYITYS